MNPVLTRAEGIFDALEERWSSHRTARTFGTVLIAVFLLALLAIELNREGRLPPPLSGALPTNHFYAVDLALTLLLFFEVLSLVFTLARSVSFSVGKQFEILSLILVRQTFKEFTRFPEPVTWEHVRPAILDMAAVAFGALLIFVVLGFYYRLQKHLPISSDPDERWSFAAAKKLTALALLLLFAGLALVDLHRVALGRESHPFFETFYTVLIFADVLLVLLSLRYSSTYAVVFRNSGFAVSTVFLRLALTSPHHIKALMGLLAALFALCLTLAYNHFAPDLSAEEADRRAPREGTA
ncbi:MAG: hypothetical protein ACP5VN_07255 [Acidobacteriota bacterium]